MIASALRIAELEAQVQQLTRELEEARGSSRTKEAEPEASPYDRPAFEHPEADGVSIREALRREPTRVRSEDPK